MKGFKSLNYQKTIPPTAVSIFWCRRRDLNPQDYAPQTYTYASSVTPAYLIYSIVLDFLFCAVMLFTEHYIIRNS